ncbi:MAG: carboxypeptidase regulatory-like domain-containing protein, partial [Candidatus Cloacimonetes bacterium]|nr:carboxypeptidase regulatory-like domain-containing protein [Candidatus Cloacimonadota bacterium]
SWLPDGWTTTGGTNWGSGSGSYAGGTPPEAKFDWSPSTTATQRLISLPVNTTGSATLELEFKHCVDHFNGTYELRLETTSDGGNNWNVVQTWPAQNLPATIENLVIDNNDVGSDNFQVAWVFDGYSWNINYWFVDDVILGGGTSAIIGTIAGHVTLTGGSGNVEDVIVSAGGFSTNPYTSGDYTLQVPPGTYDVTAELIGYIPQTVTGVVVEDGVTTNGIDFTLEAFNVPTNLTCVIMDYNDIHLEWDQPVTSRDVSSPTKALSTKLTASDTKRIETQQTDDLRDLIGYKVYRDTLVIHEITDPGETSYDDLALAAGEYEYYIVAVYDVGESEASNIETITITLPVPQNPQAVTQGQDILITWDIPSDRGFSHYKVYRNTVLIAPNVENTSYLDENVPAGTYTYNIKAVYDGGYESEFSDGAVIIHEPTIAGDILIPTKTELAGNYPNPFNPITTITYNLNEDLKVTLEIYNIKGQKVRTIVNKEQPAGYYKTIWNGKDDNDRSVASGIYFYKMKTKKYSSIKKMILMK